MSQNTIPAQNINRARVTAICERLRHQAETADWRALSGRTDTGLIDKAMILSALDYAQYMGRLAIFFDVRSASFAAGVGSWQTAQASLHRLIRQRWLIPLDNRKHPRDAQAYVINPSYPHVYHLLTPRKGRLHPRSGEGDPNLWGDWGFYVPESIRGKDGARGSLIDWFKDQSHTYVSDDGQDGLSESGTHAGNARRWLLISRTETGAFLGKTALAVYLVLTTYLPHTAAEIAHRTGLPRTSVHEALRRLEKYSLAYSEGKLWTTGLPVELFDPGTNRVEKREARIKSERDLMALRFPANEAEWIAAQLERKARMTKARYR